MSGGARANRPAPSVRLEVVPGPSLTPERRAAVLELCEAAFEEELEALYDTFAPVAHVLALDGTTLVSHALWVDRWLGAGTDAPVRTAYVELVATAPDRQGEGFGTLVMRRLADEVRERYSLAGLCTGIPGFYARLGWQTWRGPLRVRLPGGGLEPTLDEIVMVLDPADAFRGRLDEPLSVEWRRGELW